MEDLVSLGKYMSFILRHHPETIGITLDEHGWAEVDDFIRGIAKKYDFNMEILEKIVETNNKKRYSFNEDKTLIRANQGHSILVDVELDEKQPPEVLFHGTATKFVNSIDEIGLIRKSRLYVHLSADITTAVNVGKRHGKPFVYKIKSQQMWNVGYKFYMSVNGVWLTEKVPVKYLEKIEM